MAVLRRSTRLRRALYTALGFVFVGIGLIGYVTPLLPGTVFLILALWAFKRGNERFEDWLLKHPMVGPTLRDWDSNRTIKTRTKFVAIALIWLCITGSLFAVHNAWVGIMLITIACWLTWYLATRKSPTVATA